MATPQPTSALASRPPRHLVNLWIAIALFVALKAAPADSGKLVAWCLAALACGMMLIWNLGHRPLIRRWCEILLDDGPSSEGVRSNHWRWMIVGFASVATALVFLEFRQPFYFVEDDNLAQFLPVVLHGCRSLFHDGVFSTWNPHQFLGSPTSSLGTYALTYPPTYISYSIAKWLLRNEYATFEVFCIEHLLIGYLAAYWAGRQLGVRSSLAAAASACFVLSGFFLIAGRSWYYMTPTAVWMPLVVGLLARLRTRRVGWKWVLATGGALGALFHAGNAQMWCYAVLMFGACVAIWLLCRAISWSQAVPAAAALLLGIAIAMPLLIPQYRETASLHRVAGDGIFLPYVGSIFLPYPLAKAEYPGVLESPNINHIGQMYYAGTVFSIVATLGMASLLAYRWNRRLLAANVWLLLAWMALLFALGRVGGYWYLLAKLPGFSGFEHPFKFIPFVSLFMLLGGALLFERALRYGLSRRWETALCVTVGLLMGYHVWLANPSFCDYGFRPYPNLPTELQALRDDAQRGRIYAIGPRRSLATEFGLSMMHQLPTVWGFDSLGGYDPLVRRNPRYVAVVDRLFSPSTTEGLHVDLGSPTVGLIEPKTEFERQNQVSRALHTSANDDEFEWGHSNQTNPSNAIATLQAYGVRWIVAYGGPQVPKVVEGGSGDYFWSVDPADAQLLAAVRENCRLVIRRPEVTVYELADAAPLAFAAEDAANSLPTRPLSIHTSASGMTVDTSNMPSGSNIVVNILAAPYLNVYADSNRLTANTDAWGRMTIHLPPGVHQLRILYRPPWLAGFLCGAVFAACAVVLMRWGGKWETAVTSIGSQRLLMNLNLLRRAA